MTSLVVFNNYLIYLITGYFLFVSITYVLMLLISFNTIKKHSQHIHSLETKSLSLSPFAKPVSLLVPAYNEQTSIVESVKSVLQLQYSTYEIILINDGSSDNTLEQLLNSFDLVKTKNVYRPQLPFPCQDIKEIYVSSTYPNLTVVDKVKSNYLLRTS